MVWRQTNSAFGNSASRGQAVLSAIIEEHLATGEPVGSKIVAERFANASGWSSATIRNVMGELEEAGFVEQPHTSAGRVPTDEGYRFYVDNLLGVLQISAADLQFINQGLGVASSISSINDGTIMPEKLLERTSQLLSALSGNIGIVISPGLADDRLQQIRFVALADRRVLVVLVSAPHLVHHKVIRLEAVFTQDELDRTARYLNGEFAGKSLKQIRQEILRLMHQEKTLFDRLLQTAVILCSESLAGEEAAGDVYVDGASNILSKPDFTDFSQMRELLQTIEEKSRLMQILTECLKRDSAGSGAVQVVIGRENTLTSLQNCALITAPYRIGGDASITGTLSVLGPTRIEYARLIAVVGYLARLFEQVLTDDAPARS